MSLSATLQAWRDRRAERRRKRREADAEAMRSGAFSPGEARRANEDNQYRNV